MRRFEAVVHRKGSEIVVLIVVVHVFRDVCNLFRFLFFSPA